MHEQEYSEKELAQYGRKFLTLRQKDKLRARARMQATKELRSKYREDYETLIQKYSQRLEEDENF